MNAFRTDSKVTLALAALLLAVLSPPALATVFSLEETDGSLLGREERVVTRYEDTLYDIARRFSLGSEEIVRVNPGMDPWLPGAEREIVIPGQRILPQGPREGIVVNLPEHRIDNFPRLRLDLSRVLELTQMLGLNVE